MTKHLSKSALLAPAVGHDDGMSRYTSPRSHSPRSDFQGHGRSTHRTPCLAHSAAWLGTIPGSGGVSSGRGSWLLSASVKGSRSVPSMADVQWTRKFFSGRPSGTRAGASVAMGETGPQAFAVVAMGVEILADLDASCAAATCGRR